MTKWMSGRGSLLHVVQLAETLVTAGLKSEKGAIERSIGSITIGTHATKLSLYTLAGQKAVGKEAGHRVRSINNKFSIQIEAPIKKILRRLRDQGLISQGRPWQIYVACFTNVSDGDIINWSAGTAISHLSYYR
uniref:Domain X domain-containing protein n=1 Tax=Solanum lycopersicum TaxID=4081 RepID=K4CTH1_SOLLC